MVILPIVERELRVAARKGRVYWARLHGAGIGFAVLFWLLWAMDEAAGMMFNGLFMLKFIAYVTFGACVFGGATRASDAISIEKREDTLGLLFLTHLKGYDVVLGKLATASLLGFLNLLAVVPVFAVMLLVGGVALGDLIRVPLALVNCLLLSISLGLLASTVLRAQRAAMGLCAGLILILVAGMPGLSEVFRDEGWNDLSQGVLLFSPAYALEMSFGPRFGLSSQRFWLATGVQFAMSVGVLVLCSLLVPHVWQTRAGGRGSVSWSERVHAVIFGAGPMRQAWRMLCLARNPVYWLHARNRVSPWITPLLIAVIVISVAASSLYYEASQQAVVAAVIVTMFIIDLFLKMRAAGLASARLCEDRLNGSLELILSTPLSVQSFLRGEWMGLRRNALWTHLAVLALAIVAFRIVWAYHPAPTSDVILVFGFLVFVSLSDFFTIGWVAMWKAMRVNHPAHAPGLALLRVVVCPVVLFMCTMITLGKFQVSRDWIDRHEPYSVLGVALTLWAASSLLALLQARRALFGKLRTAATDRYTFEKEHGFAAVLHSVRRVLARG